MVINQRSKGARGERELAKELNRVLGTKARRGQQFSGSPDSPDVVVPELPGIHIECKRTEVLSLYKAMDQAIGDCGEDQVPVVMHRRNNKPWLVVVRLDDLIRLTKIIYKFKREQKKEKGNG